jgi:hypothetical protein
VCKRDRQGLAGVCPLLMAKDPPISSDEEHWEKGCHLDDFFELCALLAETAKELLRVGGLLEGCFGVQLRVLRELGLQALQRRSVWRRWRGCNRLGEAQELLLQGLGKRLMGLGNPGLRLREGLDEGHQRLGQRRQEVELLEHSIERLVLLLRVRKRLLDLLRGRAVRHFYAFLRGEKVDFAHFPFQLIRANDE